MFLTDFKEDADKARKWSTQSREAAPWYQHEEIGYNYRISNLKRNFGDLKNYWVADRQNRTFRRLNELYARTDQVGFLTTQRVDGRLILPESVKVLKMAGTKASSGTGGDNAGGDNGGNSGSDTSQEPNG